MHIVHLDLFVIDVDDFRFIPFAIRFDFNTLTHATPRTPLVSTNAATIAKAITMAGVRVIPPKLDTSTMIPSPVS